MIALIAWSWFSSNWTGLLVWFGLALVFSLAGDIFLLSPVSSCPGWWHSSWRTWPIW